VDTTEDKIVRTGTLTAKARPTDPVAQTWQMREWGSGLIEQYLLFGSDPGRWVKYEGQYAQEIQWQ
jgi:hypothetical protein